MALAWQQMVAIIIKRFHHSRRDWKGLISQILLPVFFVMFAMALGTIKNDLQNFPELELSPALYNFGPSYSFFRSVLTLQEHTDDKIKRKILLLYFVNVINSGIFWNLKRFIKCQSIYESNFIYIAFFAYVKNTTHQMRAVKHKTVSWFDLQSRVLVKTFRCRCLQQLRLM